MDAKKELERNRKYLQQIDENICPHCLGKLQKVKRAFDRECEKCGLYYRFMDDMGPGGYQEIGRRFDIVAFEVPNHKSLLHGRFLTKKQLLRALSNAIDKDANVISIRQVKEGVEDFDESF